MNLSQVLVQIILSVEGHIAWVALERARSNMLSIDMAFQTSFCGKWPGVFTAWPVA